MVVSEGVTVRAVPDVMSLRYPPVVDTVPVPPVNVPVSDKESPTVILCDGIAEKAVILGAGTDITEVVAYGVAVYPTFDTSRV